MRPKINVFILFLVSHYFTLSSCDEEKDRLTDIEITGIVGPMNTSEPNDDTKRDYIGDSWIVQVDLKNGTKITLNLTLTEGILIDKETPIWNARLNRSGGSIEYNLNKQIMSRLRDFHLYQDYANKAAVAVFYKDPWLRTKMSNVRYYSRTDRGYYIEGWVAFHRLDRSNFPSALGILKKQKSSPYSQSAGRFTGIQSEWDGFYDETKTRTPPADVYLEILIHLDRAQVSKYQAVAMRRMIGYWNAVDMLYSKLENPHIKINIAGMILPQDNYSTPWLTSNEYEIKGETRVNITAIHTLGNYFSTLRHQFPDDSYDFLFSFTSYKLNELVWSVTGVAEFNVSCKHREARAAVISTLSAYPTSAHELAHLLSNHHDENSECKNKSGIMGRYKKTNVDQLEWSYCSEESFTDYFRGSRTKCFDNCPSTIKNCEKLPIRRCLILGYEACLLLGYDYNFQQEIDCVKDLECLHGSDLSRVILVPIPNGTIIEGDGYENLYSWICSNGQVIARDWKEPVCRN